MKQKYIYNVILIAFLVSLSFWLFFSIVSALFRNNKFMLDEILQQNASKFAIMLCRQRSGHFSLNECPDL